MHTVFPNTHSPFSPVFWLLVWLVNQAENKYFNSCKCFVLCCYFSFPEALSSSSESDGLARWITLRSIVKKSKWSWTSTSNPPPARDKTKLFNQLKPDQNSYLVLIDRFLVNFLFSSLFSPTQKSIVSSKFEEQAMVAPSPRPAPPSWCRRLLVRSCATGSGPGRRLWRGGAPCWRKCSHATPGGVNKWRRGKQRWDRWRDCGALLSLVSHINLTIKECKC